MECRVNRKLPDIRGGSRIGMNHVELGDITGLKRPERLIYEVGEQRDSILESNGCTIVSRIMAMWDIPIEGIYPVCSITISTYVKVKGLRRLKT